MHSETFSDQTKATDRLCPKVPPRKIAGCNESKERLADCTLTLRRREEENSTEQSLFFRSHCLAFIGMALAGAGLPMTHLIPTPSWHDVAPDGDFTEEASGPRVVIAYEDLAMGLQAMNAFASISRVSGIGRAELSLWRFDLLDHHRWRMRASDQAEQADVVIVALRRDHSLPIHVHSWVEHWGGRRKHPEGALAVVFDSSASQRVASQCEAAVDLQKIAAAAGLDFICELPMGNGEGMAAEWRESSPN